MPKWPRSNRLVDDCSFLEHVSSIVVPSSLHSSSFVFVAEFRNTLMRETDMSGDHKSLM